MAYSAIKRTTCCIMVKWCGRRKKGKKAAKRDLRERIVAQEKWDRRDRMRALKEIQQNEVQSDKKRRERLF